MIRVLLLAVMICSVPQAAMAASSALYFSCPSLDKRADDLLIIIDQPSGTASLQSEKSGEGLNFTSPASFGPKQVTWRNESNSYPQKFSIDRVTMVLKRETTSAMSGSVYAETSPCTMVKPPSNTKF
jgi:hypothetical protein